MHEFVVQMYLFALKALEYTLESERMIIKQPVCPVSERNAYKCLVGNSEVQRLLVNPMLHKKVI